VVQQSGREEVPYWSVGEGGKKGGLFIIPDGLNSVEGGEGENRCKRCDPLSDRERIFPVGGRRTGKTNASGISGFRGERRKTIVFVTLMDEQPVTH